MEHAGAPPREEPEHGMVIGGIPLGDGGPLRGAALLRRREYVRGHVQRHRPLAIHPRRFLVDDRDGLRLHGEERGGRDSDQLDGRGAHSMDQPHDWPADALPQVLWLMGPRGGLAERWLARVDFDADAQLGTPDPQVRQVGRPIHTVSKR